MVDILNCFIVYDRNDKKMHIIRIWFLVAVRVYKIKNNPFWKFVKVNSYLPIKQKWQKLSNIELLNIKSKINF